MDYEYVKKVFSSFTQIDIEKYKKDIMEIPLEKEIYAESAVSKVENIVNVSNKIFLKDKDKKIDFVVKKDYSKKYYAISKISDEACEIHENEKCDYYIISFLGTQIIEIETLYYILNFDLPTFLNIDGNDNLAYLLNNSKTYYRLKKLQDILDEYNNLGLGYYFLPNCLRRLIVDSIKSEKAVLKERYQNAYSEIVAENRAPSIWKHEYMLFSMVKKYVQNAIYQYHCSWLGNQSFDIFLPDYNLAIEYQGEQHYEAVEHWGGEEGLKNTQLRDEKKLMIAKQNNVTVYYWHYLDEITDKTVTKLLTDNNIPIDNSNVVNSNHCEMAPIILQKNIKKNKSTNKKNIKKNKSPNDRNEMYYIVQYDLSGKYIARYNSIVEASKSVDISSTSINKVLSGKRNTAAGFIWKKIAGIGNIQQVISIDFDVEKSLQGAQDNLSNK